MLNFKITMLQFSPPPATAPATRGNFARLQGERLYFVKQSLQKDITSSFVRARDFKWKNGLFEIKENGFYGFFNGKRLVLS